MQTWMAQVRMKADQFSELTLDSLAAVNQPAIVKEETRHFSVRIQRQLTNFHLWSSAHYGCYSKHLQVKHIRCCSLCSCKATEISTDERWITGSLLGCQRASRTPFTSTLTGAKHQWLELPTINDLLQEDQNAFSVFRVTTDLQQPSPSPSIPMNYAPLISWQTNTKRSLTEIGIQTMEVVGSTRATPELRPQGSEGVVYIQNYVEAIIIKQLLLRMKNSKYQGKTVA